MEIQFWGVPCNKNLGTEFSLSIHSPTLALSDHHSQMKLGCGGVIVNNVLVHIILAVWIIYYLKEVDNYTHENYLRIWPISTGISDYIAISRNILREICEALVMR